MKCNSGLCKKFCVESMGSLRDAKGGCSAFDAGQCSSEAKDMICKYMALFERRSKGELPTPAGWMRARLAKHASNSGDGSVPGAFVRDLCTFAAKANDPSEVHAE